MATTASLKTRQLSDYPFHLDYRTRWIDNDQYTHLNNSIYYHLFDSIVNTYLIKHCGLHPPTSSQIGLVVHSSCDYFAPAEFPAVLDVAMRVRKLGKSSVTYECAVFERLEGEGEKLAAVGEFIHVYVDRTSRRPGKDGMGVAMREGLERLVKSQVKL